MSRKVLIHTIGDLQKLTNSAIRTPFEVTAKQDKYVVDGKSLMGMFSLDLTSVIMLEYESDNDKAVEAFEQAIAEYIVKE